MHHDDAARNDGPPADAAPDAVPDAPPDAACKHVLLAGGSDVTAQGWTTIAQAPDTITYGADYVQLATTTTTGQMISGQLLLSYPHAFATGAAFKLEVVALVQAVNPHNQFDSAAAIMGSLTGTVGSPPERSEMIYLDAAAVGWADDSQSAAFAVTDGNFHTYVLAVDATGGAALTIDGAPALTRTGFTSNGTIAVGDQSNDANLDSTVQIRSVTLLCP